MTVVITLYLGLRNTVCNRRLCTLYGRPGLRVSGFGTAYLNNSTSMALGCAVDVSETPLLVAINRNQFWTPPSRYKAGGDGKDESPSCGKCMWISGPQGNAMAKVVGYCESCERGSILVSKTVFDIIGKGLGDTVAVTWSPCSDDD
ncbi:hypothetical protein EV182_005683 [Spiromyces aspiralis]|uniref:Uncharacterized protein n=1 Tax=Spiromyces aspiralis TaxID=68401 RepID=A0ACC1HCU4_9FUNG|nr:hypothetical protein EV182_005683 [Spiromyces aspiralis]